MLPLNSNHRSPRIHLFVPPSHFIKEAAPPQLSGIRDSQVSTHGSSNRNFLTKAFCEMSQLTFSPPPAGNLLIKDMPALQNIQKMLKKHEISRDSGLTFILHRDDTSRREWTVSGEIFLEVRRRRHLKLEVF